MAQQTLTPDPTRPTSSPPPDRDGAVRVPAGLLDQLMTLVGELVVSRNELVDAVARVGAPELAAPSQRISHLTTELQDGVMRTRLQPIGAILAPLAALVADAAADAGVHVRLEVEGAETEVEGAVLEALRDQLAALVADVVAHGIDEPAARASAGKPADATLSIRAYHEGGQVHLDVVDDGRGTDRSGSDASQAAAAALEGIGGSLERWTTPGAGATARLGIPLTLAIIPALLVGAGPQRFAVPQISLVEVVRLDGERATTGIEEVHGAPVLRLRGQLLPLVDLTTQLGLPAGAGRSTSGGEAVSIVVLDAEGHTFGLVVDEIADSHEIVIRPLDGHVKGLTHFAGATTMGGGEVVLILDVRGLATAAGIVTAQRRAADRASARQSASGATPTSATDPADELLLVCAPVEGRRVAMPLGAVDRLERIAVADVESADGGEVLQYRDEIIGIVDLALHLGMGPIDRTAAPHVEAVIVTVDGAATAVLIGRVLDTAQSGFTPLTGGGPIVGRAVIAERVTDVVDVRQLVTEAGLGALR